MRISLLTVGTELLDGMIPETNSNRIENALESAGLALQRKMTVRDDDREIITAMEFLKNKSDAIILTGGLGPTEDDRTRSAVASFLGKKLETDQTILEELRAKFKAMNRPMPAEIERQAQVIPGSTIISNPKGTAPGFIFVKSTLTVAALPGVPSELEAMFPEFIKFLKANFHIVRGTSSVLVRTIGLPESFLDKTMATLLKDKGYSVGTIAHFGHVDIRLEKRNSVREETAEEVKLALEKAPDIRDRTFSMDRDTDIAQALVRKLAYKGAKVLLAESCTGGLISKLVTDVPGSSQVFPGGAVVYDDDLKKKLLGVDADTLGRYGAVSFETAFAMTEGLRRTAGADYYVSVTGIAGPGGGSLEKPVGTVFIGFGKKDGTAVMRFQFGGNRDNIRTRTAMKVFEILWLDLASGKVDYPELYGLKDLIIQ